MRKRNIILIVTVASIAIAGGIGMFVRSQNVAEVQSVSMLNAGYMGDNSTMDGNVVNGSTQQVFAASSLLLTETYVKDGQQVHIGDKLVAYDLTSLQIAVEEAQLQIQQTNIDIENTKRNIQKYQNTQPIIPPTPYPEPTPMPTPEPTPIPTTIPEAEKTEGTDAWNLISSFDQRYTPTEEPEPLKPKIEPTIEPTTEPTSQPTAEPTTQPTVEPTSEPAAEPTIAPTQEPEPTVEPEQPKPGTVGNPYRFLVNEEGVVYGKLFNEMKQKYPMDQYGKLFVQLEIREDNKIDADPISVWMIRVDRFPTCEDYDCYDVQTHQKIIPEEEEIIEEPVMEEEIIEDIPDGYTAQELAQMISQEKQTLQSLQITQKRNMLNLQEQQQALTDGVIYAKKDGVVKLTGERSSTQPYIIVSGSGGLEIEGAVSERMFSKLSLQQTLYATDWQTGTTFQVTVHEIDRFPTTTMYYSDDDSSFYGFRAYTDEQTDLTEGSYLSISMQEGNMYDNQNIYLPDAYIKKDKEGSYVLKAVNGKLEKTYITIGQRFYGQYSEIKSGLNETDYIAFPYGRSGKPGVKVKLEDMQDYTEGSVWEG